MMDVNRAEKRRFVARPHFSLRLGEPSLSIECCQRSGDHRMGEWLSPPMPLDVLAQLCFDQCSGLPRFRRSE